VAWLIAHKTDNKLPPKYVSSTLIGQNAARLPSPLAGRSATTNRQWLDEGRVRVIKIIKVAVSPLFAKEGPGEISKLRINQDCSVSSISTKSPFSFLFSDINPKHDPLARRFKAQLLPVHLLDINGTVSMLFHGDTSYVAVCPEGLLIPLAHYLNGVLEGPFFFPIADFEKGADTSEFTIYGTAINENPSVPRGTYHFSRYFCFRKIMAVP
jgi:hypothetical protein